MKFRWKLDKYRSVLNQQEKVILAKLMLQITEIRKIDKNISRIEIHCKAMIDDFSQQSVNDRMAHQKQIFSFLNGKKLEIQNLLTDKNILVEKKSTIETELFELRQKIEMLTKLYEKARSEFITKQEKIQQEEIEELFQLRFKNKAIAAE